MTVRTRIGVTGHQERIGIDWKWVEATVRYELSKLRPIEALWSSLAIGSDQLCAEVAIGLDIAVVAVVPTEGYERFFENEGLANYRRLVSRSSMIQLAWKGAPERSFLEAGKYIVDQTDLLVAVWDGQPGEAGGTAEVVEHARSRGRGVVHINPIDRSLHRS